jgi:hypothetical protein
MLASLLHRDDMLARSFFSHSGSNGGSAGQRATEATSTGYVGFLRVRPGERSHRLAVFPLPAAQGASCAAPVRRALAPPRRQAEPAGVKALAHRIEWRPRGTQIGRRHVGNGSTAPCHDPGCGDGKLPGTAHSRPGAACRAAWTSPWARRRALPQLRGLTSSSTTPAHTTQAASHSPEVTTSPPSVTPSTSPITGLTKV